MEQIKTIPESEPIRTVLLEVRNYRARAAIQYHMYDYNTMQADSIERAKRHATADLLNHIERFVNFDLNAREGYVEAMVYLPFVQNDVVKDLRREAENLNNELNKTRRMHDETRAYNRKLEAWAFMPWHKKLWLYLWGKDFNSNWYFE